MVYCRVSKVSTLDKLEDRYRQFDRACDGSVNIARLNLDGEVDEKVFLMKEGWGRGVNDGFLATNPTPRHQHHCDELFGMVMCVS